MNVTNQNQSLVRNELGHYFIGLMIMYNECITFLETKIVICPALHSVPEIMSWQIQVFNVNSIKQAKTKVQLSVVEL